MRWAWECSRTGHQNVACAALADAFGYQYPYFEHINAMLNMDGFLTKKEKWHTARMRKNQITAYRGCSINEIESGEFGHSWTLDKEVAHFFADAHHGKVVAVTLRRSSHCACWLDTSESEIIATGVTKADIVQIEDAAHSQINMEWSKRKHVTPMR